MRLVPRRRVRLADNATRIKEAFAQGSMEGVRDAMDRIVELAKERVPVKHGTTQRMISAGPVSRKGKRIQGKFGAYAPNSAALEWGTAGRGEPIGSTYHSPVGVNDWPRMPPGKRTFAPYIIKPIPPRKFLRWEDERGVHFRRQVTHPGIEASPFMRPAIDIVRVREGPRIIAARIERRLMAVAKKG